MEILVMLAVLGILLAAGLPGFRNMMEGYRHKGSVDRVTSKLFLTRQLAVRDKVPWVVTLDVANRQMSAFGDDNSNGVRDAGEDTRGPWTMYDDVNLVNVSWAGNQVTFFPNGRASQTADLQVVDNYFRSRTVRISSITGNAEVLP
jgi:Tfp pilus assembly protein FimT